MARWFLVFTLILTAISSTASAQYIGIFMDASSATCAADVGEQPWISLHLFFINEGDSETAGAVFSVIGAPDTWNEQNVLWVPDPAVNIALGHPVFPNSSHRNLAGTSLAFTPSCLKGPGGRFPLGRLVILGASTPENVHLQVAGVQVFATDPDCPLGFMCDAPTYPQYCARGGEAFLNGDSTQPDCQVAVEAITWTAVRRLYQDSTPPLEESP